MRKPEIFIIAGPTAVGKTNISVKFAKEIGAEIISCDSMQIYEGMDIGSAKVTSEEMDGVKHHLISFVNPFKSYSVAEYKEDCIKAIKEINNQNKPIVMTGGTGLYIDSVIKDLSFTQSAKDDSFREELTRISIEKGKDALFNILKDIDPISAQVIHPNNVKRVIRAIEVTKVTGKPFSSFKQEEKLNDDFIIHYYYLNMDRSHLYERINLRVLKMFEDGLVEEVKRLKDLGLDKSYQAMQGIGYKEMLDYLDGVYSLEEAKEKIAQNSRNYAKRQLTWFRNEKLSMELSKDSMSDDEIINFLKKIYLK